MDTEKSLEIISALNKEVDPHTGEEYSADSPYQHPQTLQALSVAMQALELVKRSDERRKRQPRNAGKPWAEEEDQRLVNAFDSGKLIKQIAEEHERTESSICLRLIMHDKIK